MIQRLRLLVARFRQPVTFETLEPEDLCPVCGTPTLPTWTFCEECGRRLRA